MLSVTGTSFHSSFESFTLSAGGMFADISTKSISVIPITAVGGITTESWEGWLLDSYHQQHE